MKAFVVFAFLFSVPIYILAFSALTPLAVDASGTRLVGLYRRWHVTSITGRVRGANTYTTTSGGAIYADGSRQYTSTTVHDRLLLVDSAGQQHGFTLANFRIEVFDDQVVSVCTAVRGRKQVIVAVLNHSTRRQSTRRDALTRITLSRRVFWNIWLPLSVIMLGIGLIPSLIYAVTYRLQLRRFEKRGIRPLWTSTAMPAAALEH
jgi:hypothetical protein